MGLIQKDCFKTSWQCDVSITYTNIYAYTYTMVCAIEQFTASRLI